MKKVLFVLLVLAVAFTAFANAETEAAATTEKQWSKADWGAEPTGTTDVTIWCFFGETMRNQYQVVVDAFNASQSKYHVTVEPQGSQGEMTAKLAATELSELPDAFMAPVENTAQYATSGYATPLQEFMDLDEEGWPEYEGTWEAIKAAYQDENGMQWGYPEGYSYGALFYNADMLEANGIDINSIKCLDDLLAACRKLKAAGVVSPIGFHPDGFYFNEMLAREGLMYYDNNNGFSGNITKCLYVEDEKVNAAVTKMLDFYQTVSKEELCVPYGSNYQKEVIPQIAQGNTCFFIGVVSITTKILNAVGDKFTVGVCPLVSITAEGSRKGEMAGGTGMFICDNGDKWAQNGAYEFTKFASQAEWAGYFAAATGYLAPSQAAYNSEAYQEFLKKCPTFASVYESLANSDSSGNSPYIPIGTEMKAANKLATSTVCSDTSADIQAVIKTACDTINEAIELYNMSNL